VIDSDLKRSDFLTALLAGPSEGLRGPTIGANERHIAAQVALLNELYHDPRTLATFERLGNETVLLAEAQRLAGILDDIAHELGHESRGYLFEDCTLPDLEAAIGVPLTAVGNFGADVFTTDPDPFVTLVRDTFGIPWPWVAWELLHRFGSDLIGVVVGMELATSIGVAQGATPDDTLHGRRPAKVRGSDETTSERHAMWYYQTAIKQPPDSISAIARDENASRGTIRQGIDTAREELSAVASIGCAQVAE
jgi:hypothetical protein